MRQDRISPRTMSTQLLSVFPERRAAWLSLPRKYCPPPVRGQSSDMQRFFALLAKRSRLETKPRWKGTNSWQTAMRDHPSAAGPVGQSEIQTTILGGTPESSDRCF